MGKGQENNDIGRTAALDARDWIVRLTAGNVEREELERFRAWQAHSPENQRAFDREREFWRLLQGVKVEAGQATEAAPVRVPVPAARIGRRRFILGGAVAATAAAVAAPSVLAWLRTDFSTGSGEQRAETLPDGSRMLLNTDSRVAIDFSDGRRLVELIDGEAEFSVARRDGPAFRVAALGGTSDADDGTFALRALDGEAVVTATTSLVQVAGAGTRVDLGPGQQTRYLDGAAPLPPRAVNLDTELAWRTGRVVFEGKPFGRAVRELGRYVPERIVVTNHAHDGDLVSAMFLTGDAQAAIAALAHTRGLSVRRVPGMAILIS